MRSQRNAVAIAVWTMQIVLYLVCTIGGSISTLKAIGRGYRLLVCAHCGGRTIFWTLIQVSVVGEEA